MSLLRPTPGEILDRVSIVTIKISAYGAAGKPTESLDRELKSLLSYFTCNFGNNKALLKLENIGGNLELTNRELWNAEDSIRDGDNFAVHHIAIVAKNIARLNDERNRLIREIDEAYGCENPVEEKIYSCTPRQS